MNFSNIFTLFISNHDFYRLGIDNMVYAFDRGWGLLPDG